MSWWHVSSLRRGLRSGYSLFSSLCVQRLTSGQLWRLFITSQTHQAGGKLIGCWRFSASELLVGWWESFGNPLKSRNLSVWPLNIHTILHSNRSAVWRWRSISLSLSLCNTFFLKNLLLDATISVTFMWTNECNAVKLLQDRLPESVRHYSCIFTPFSEANVNKHIFFSDIQSARWLLSHQGAPH